MKVATRCAWAVVVALVVGLVASAAHVERWFGVGRPGRLVFDVDLPTLDPPDSIERILVAWDQRLGGRGVAIEPGVLPADLRVTVDGTGAEAEAIRALLTRAGQLGFHEVVSDTAVARAWYQRAVAHELGPDIAGQPDSWTNEKNGDAFTDYYLTGPTAEALDAAVAQLAAVEPLPADLRVRYERVVPWHEPGEPDRAPYLRTYVIAAEPAVDGHDVARANVTYDQNTLRPEVVVRFSRDGARRFGELTERLVGHKLAIVLDGDVTSAPIVQTRIAGGVCTITMAGSDHAQQDADATALVNVLRAGAILPEGLAASLRAARPGARGSVWLPRLAFALLAFVAAFGLAPRLARRSPLAAELPVAPGLVGFTRVLVALAVTVGLPVALIVLAPHLLLPGVDPHGRAEASFAVREFASPSRESLSVFCLGVMSVITGFWLVELVAALTPRWRARRLATPGDRRGLDRAAVAVGLVVATIQGYFVARYLQLTVDPGSSLLAPGATALVVAVLSAVAGVAAQIVVADLISRHGLCNGYLALIGVGTARALYRTVAISPRPGLDDLRPALVAALAVIALIVVIASALRDRSPARRRLPWVGIVPIALLATAAGVGLLLAQVFAGGAPRVAWLDVILAPPAWLDVAVAVGATVALVVARRIDRDRFGLVVTGAVIASLLAVRHLTPAPLSISAWIIPAVLLVGLVLEAGLAARARLGQTSLLVVLAVHDVDRADRAADALAAAGICASVEGRRLRAILRGLGGFAPIVVRVSSVDFDRAIEVVAATEAARSPALAAFAE